MDTTTTTLIGTAGLTSAAVVAAMGVIIGTLFGAALIALSKVVFAAEPLLATVPV